jgi:hypothetical protein
MAKNKKIKDEGYITHINPEYDEEFEQSVDPDLPLIPSLKKKSKEVKPRKFKLNGDTEGNNLLSKKNLKSRKAH